MAQKLKMMKHSLVLCAALLATVWGCASRESKSSGALSAGFDLSSLDTGTAACEDFFGYSANAWIEKNPIPETEGLWGSFHVLNQQNEFALKALLDSLQKNPPAADSYARLLADFNQSMIDTSTIERKGLSVLKPVFGWIDSLESNASLGGWFPVCQGYGFDSPLSAYVGADDRRSSHNIATVSQSGLGLPDRDYYLERGARFEGLRKQYVKHIQNMFKLAGLRADESTALGIFELEKSMAQAMMSRQDRRIPEKVYNKMSKDEFVALARTLDLESYLGACGLEVDSLICAQPDYVRAIDQMLVRYPLDRWQDYFRWSVLRARSAALPKAIRDESFAFYGKALRGISKPKPRWRQSLDRLEDGLSEPLGRLYAERYFPESSKKRISDMVENIRSAYGERIDKLEWMSAETKLKAHEKLAAFTYKIGYPEQWKSFDGLKVDRGDLVGNLNRIQRFGFEENISKAGKPVDKKEWFMGAHMVNAYYNPSFNEIVFPAGILQPPFFNPEADEAINYGAIGAVIGHEFTHGFDDQGRKYDAQGNLRNWWTGSDSAAFEQLTEKLVAQYNRFEALPGAFVNGRLTLGENIADLGGLTIAYYAYQKSLKGKKSTAIEGFSGEQRFFLGWAGVWQISYKEETLRDRLITDYHSPGNFRVIGPISNMKEFGEAWSCMAPSGMQRPSEEQVSIW